MRLGLFILLFLVPFWSIGQGLEPSQIQGAPKLNDILQAKNMYIDEYGDTLYIYQHTSIDGLITSTDSIYVRNDTIFLRDGSGFVKKLKAGQTVTVQTAIINDTIYSEVNANSLDSVQIKNGGIARNDLSFAIDDSKWTQSGSNLYPKVIGSNVGVNTTNPLYKLDISGDLRVTSRTGSAIVGAGFDSNGKLVEYNLDTAIMIPETYINSGTDISITGNGAFTTPYVINNTQTHQDLFPYSTGFIVSNPTPTLQDTVIFQYSSPVISTPPTGCNCGILDIPNLQTALDGKALISHTHTIADITGLQAALDGKAATSHTHTIANVTGLQTALDGKEASFAKGNIVQGTGVTITGTLTNRLVGSGDVTINASGGGGSVTISESTSVNVLLSTVNTTLGADLTLTAGTYLINAYSSAWESTGTDAKSITLEIFNATSNTTLAVSSEALPISGDGNISLSRSLTLGSTATIRLRARTSLGAGYSLASSITALKIN